MSIAETITKRIDTIGPGTLFSYRDFKAAPNTMEAMAAILSRLAAKGIIRRFEKGKYFKPQEGMFGEVPLKTDQIVESLIKENGHLIGYVTGAVAYNNMGLTTQISNEYTIATYQFRKPIQKGRVKARFVKAYCGITEVNIPQLQLLDAIKDIRSIPGTETNTALELIKMKIEKLSLNEQKKLGQLALTYPSSVRALTGAVLERLNNKPTSERLYKSLNFLSTYKLGIKEAVLPNKDKWRIE
jgi:predicted transcriptional regulator of viral defense system